MDGNLLYLAPFQGITTDVFMDVYTRMFGGIDKLFTAFFTSVYHEKKLKRAVHDLNRTYFNNIPVVPQILSKDGPEIIRFANICHDYGYGEINWNLGCPFPRVANKQRGSGLLPYPEKISEILDSVMTKLPLKLSIKCRLGYHRADEIMKLMPVFNNYPLSELIIHARIGKQLYQGDVDIDSFEKALSQSRVPVVYNGDIFNPDDFELYRNRFKDVNRWMIGRGLLSDPFLSSDIKNKAMAAGRHEYVRKYVNELYYNYRKAMNDRPQAINRMKELWSYLSQSFDFPGKVFGLVKKTKNFEEYENAVAKVFSIYHWKSD